jgi:uncharacterized repeat protein (TIGR03803 family)
VPLFFRSLLGQDGNFYGTTAYGGPDGAGSIFRMTPGGQIKFLASFNGKNGASPQAALIQGSDGNFYGTTMDGGASGQGTIFRVTPGGVLDLLYSFTGGNDGANPICSLVFGTDGNLYGTAPFGGSVSGSGTAFRVTTAGSFTLLYSFQNYATGVGANPNGLVLGLDGNFYGTAHFGGTYDAGTVFRMTPSGATNVLYSFTGGSDGGLPYTNLTLGSDGAFYGTTIFLNGGYLGTLFKVTSTGVFTSLYSFTGGSDGAWVGAPLVQASDGSFYGISSLGGRGGNGTIFRVSSDGVFTSLYQLPGPDVSGNTPLLPNRAGLVQAPDGSLYGTVPQLYDPYSDDGDVFRITPAGKFTRLISFVARNGEAPVAVVSGRDGNLYGSAAIGGPRNEGTLFSLASQDKLETFLNFDSADGAIPNTLIQGTDGDLYGVTERGALGFGTIFRATTQGSILWQINLDSSNGAFPYAGLLQGNDGSFYGTTAGGGRFDSGTVFRVTPGGVLKTLYSFTGSTDGGFPDAPLIQGSNGELYGSTFQGGGVSESGTIFRISPSGAFRSLYAFTGGSDGGYPSAALTLGDDGKLYGTTFSGGVNFVGNVFQITTTGAFTTIYSFDFVGGGGNSPLTSLVLGNDGIFYGSTFLGGTFGAGTIYSITNSGTETTLYSFTDGADGVSPVSLTLGANNTLYGTTNSFKADTGTVFEFTP